MISSVRPSTSTWSLPWMLLRYKAFSRDTPIIPLISGSGNALGSDCGGCSCHSPHLEHTRVGADVDGVVRPLVVGDGLAGTLEAAAMPNVVGLGRVECYQGRLPDAGLHAL
jgi:hypothetical protein